MTSKSRDRLTTTTDEAKIELHEEELRRATGGFKIKFNQIIVSHQSTGGAGNKD
jgi:hypothetical protein